jgi:hypothetical protein
VLSHFPLVADLFEDPHDGLELVHHIGNVTAGGGLLRGRAWCSGGAAVLAMLAKFMAQVHHRISASAMATRPDHHLGPVLSVSELFMD